MYPPRYFGMSILQISSLAVMGVLNGIILAVGATLVIANGSSSFTMPQLARRLPTPTPQPTPTPLPTATPKPTPTPIPGWEMFVGGGVELWLPESYAGGDPATEMESITAQIEALGPFNQIIEDEQQLSQAGYALFAFDTHLGNAVSLTTVQVSREPLNAYPGITPEEYLNALIRRLPPDVRLLDRRTESLDNYEAGRLFVEYRFTDLGLDLFRKRAIYAVHIKNTMWVVQYLAERDNFQEHLPVFETSIRTFRVR